MGKLTCDFCLINDYVGVYATDYAPISLSYCDECLKYKNIRTIGSGLLKWARFGDKSFEEYSDLLGCEPTVFFKGNYITLRNLIKIITVNDIKEYLNIKDQRIDLIITRIEERM